MILSNLLLPFYDATYELIGFGRAFKDRVITASGFRYNESLLDIGCGSATLLMHAKSKHPTSRVVGVEPNERVLQMAKRKIKNGYGLNIELLHSGAEKLPFENGSFDVVVSSLAFHHMRTDSKKKAMQEIHRVLRPNGRFLLADLGPEQTIMSKILFNLLIILGIENKEFLKDNFEGNMPALLSQAGFNVDELGQPYRGVVFWLVKKMRI